MTEFYGKFHPRIADVEENADRATGDRVLGVDPKTGKMYMPESEGLVLRSKLEKLMMKRNQSLLL